MMRRLREERIGRGREETILLLKLPKEMQIGLNIKSCLKERQ